MKRAADSKLFYVPNGGWLTVNGFEECTNADFDQLPDAQDCGL